MASGRKKSFSESEALVAAMQVFWAKGYVGASLSDLTKSMGINKPSMYSAFGNKEALFIQTTQLYIENSEQKHAKFLSEQNTPLSDDVESIELGLNKNAEEHALCIMAALRGTATMARAGTAYNELEAVIDNTLRGIGLLPCKAKITH